MTGLKDRFHISSPSLARRLKVSVPKAFRLNTRLRRAHRRQDRAEETIVEFILPERHGLVNSRYTSLCYDYGQGNI